MRSRSERYVQPDVPACRPRKGWQRLRRLRQLLVLAAKS